MEDSPYQSVIQRETRPTLSTAWNQGRSGSSTTGTAKNTKIEIFSVFKVLRRVRTEISRISLFIWRLFGKNTGVRRDQLDLMLIQSSLHKGWIGLNSPEVRVK